MNWISTFKRDINVTPAVITTKNHVVINKMMLSDTTVHIKKNGHHKVLIKNIKGGL